MKFFNELMKRIEDICEVKKVKGRPVSIKVGESLVTEVLYNGDIYRIIIQKDKKG